MTPLLQHHPEVTLLTDYAAGNLRLSHALCIAAHLEHCDLCRQYVSKLNQIGAQLFEKQILHNNANYQHIKNNVMNMLDEITLSPEASITILDAPQKNRNEYYVPRCLGQFIPEDYSSLQWSHVSPSIKVASLLRDRDGSHISLSRVKAGGTMPHHMHTGTEITLVLEGSFSDEDGLYHKGDFIYRDSHDTHKPVVTKDAECICLMVLDAPIQFTGFFARWLNPLLRIQHP